MDRVALQVAVVLLLFNALSLRLLVAGRQVTRGRFPLRFRFGTFESDYFAWHNVCKLEPRTIFTCFQKAIVNSQKRLEPSFPFQPYPSNDFSISGRAIPFLNIVT